MNPVTQGVLIAAATLIIREVLVFYVFKRIEDFDALRSDIAEALTFYGDIYANAHGADTESIYKTRTALRIFSAKLRAFRNRRHTVLGAFKVPTKVILKDAADGLMQLSNATDPNGQYYDPKYLDKVKTALSLD
jgi:hypothetical protein